MNLLKDLSYQTAAAQQVWLFKEDFAGEVKNVYVFNKKTDGEFDTWAAAFLRRAVVDLQYTKNASGSEVLKIRIK